MADEEEEKISVNQSSGTTILCIDDDREILNPLEIVLARVYYTVITALYGKQATVEVRSRKPD